MQFYNVILQQHVGIPTNPRDIAYNECVNVLKQSIFAISFEEVVKSACRSNEHVKRYLGDKFKMQDNIKLRPLLDMLHNHSSIKQLQQKPVVLQWFNQDGGALNCSNERLSHDDVSSDDVSKPYDTYDAQTDHINKSFGQGSSTKLQDNSSLSTMSGTKNLDECYRIKIILKAYQLQHHLKK